MMKLSPIAVRYVMSMVVFSVYMAFITIKAAADDQDAVCARVKIEIRQELTLERQGFDAHMKIINGLSHISLEDLQVTVDFTDENGNPVSAGSDPNDPNAVFFIRIDSMTNINAVDGTGSVASSTAADIHWLIVPSSTASNGAPQGTMYYVGATLDYTMGGESYTTRVDPDYIFVKPMPEITLDYFIPSDVYADDPLTQPIEESVPFSLGVRAKNSGYGIAKSLKIDSAQPKIVENQQGLNIGFVIEQSRVNGEVAQNTMLADLGDIKPGKASVALWIMTCSLSGQFVEFTADLTHSDELGGELTSLIHGANTHLLVREVLVDMPGRDSVIDFLAVSGSTYMIYESDGADTQVSDRSLSASLQFDGYSGLHTHYRLTTPMETALFYIKLDDPTGGRMRLVEAVRSDGKLIKPENAWQSKTRNPDNSWQHFINLFDFDTTGQYTLVFENPAAGPKPPVLQFIRDRSRQDGTQLSFIVEATDPNGTIPMLSASPLPAGAQFIDQGNGVGIFDWIPTSGQTGIYKITFTASDGMLQDSQQTAMTIHSGSDTDGDGMPDSWEMAWFGTLERDGTGDLDGDGIPDLDEYLNDMDPTAGENAPTSPVILTPLNGGQTADASPLLTIQNSTDSDNDPLAYSFELYSDAGMKSMVLSSPQIAQTNETTSWEPGTLSDNTAYYWRVRASDAKAYSLWSYGGFFVNTANDPPSSFHIGSPEAGIQVDTAPPVLTVSNASDPDRDTILYGFQVYSDINMTTMVASASDLSQGDNGTTSWTIDTQLIEGETYFWKATATDEHGAQSTTPLSSFTVNTSNAAPGVPEIFAPAQDSQVNTQQVDLVVVNGVDLDGDALFYEFELDTVNTFDSSEKQSSGSVQEQTDTTLWSVADLSDNTIYYWRVKVSDGICESQWIQGKFFVNTQNDAPDAPILKNPGKNAWSGTLSPTLEVFDATDPDKDTLSYRFEVFDDVSLNNPVAHIETSDKHWTVSQQLTDLRWYYWRVRAVDEHGLYGQWSEVSSFFVKQTQTAPADITVRVLKDTSVSISAIRVYAFTASGTYTNRYRITDEHGLCLFDPADFESGEYKFRADYMGYQFWSDSISIPQVMSVDLVIPEQSVQTIVSTAAGPAENIRVYLFTESGTYLNQYQITDVNGNVSFDLPEGKAYKLRADIMSNMYWSDLFTAASGQENDVSIDAGGGTFGVTVQKDPAMPLQSVRVYLFSTGGAYLNLFQETDTCGNVLFHVPQGTYKVRADYLGYQFWSPDTQITENTDIDLEISHQDVTFTVNTVFEGTSDPLQGVRAYLFTGSNAYMNLYETTQADGTVVFNLPEKAYKVRADYLDGQYFSDISTWQNRDIQIPMADAPVTVSGNGQLLSGINVYVFSETGTYLNISGSTDETGSVLFRLPAGNYRFRADYQSNMFWSGVQNLVQDMATPVTISTGGGSFTLAVMKNAIDPLTGVQCFVFDENGTYLNLTSTTDTLGQATLGLSDGTYKIRIDYLGYSYWTQTVIVPDTLDILFEIPHQDVMVTVEGDLAGDVRTIQGLPVYLFTSSGTFLNISQITDAYGQVSFNLPAQSYKVRTDYLTKHYWSTAFSGQDSVITIPEGIARVHVTGSGQSLSNVPVYLFTESGAYLDIHAVTDETGIVEFRLAQDTCRFRADYQNNQYWASAAIARDVVNTVQVDTGGGLFELTVDNGQNPMADKRVYVFNTAGTYLNMYATTNVDGKVAFGLAEGDYKFRVDHMGYQFWTDVYSVPATLSGTFAISHQNVTVTVERMYQISEPLSGVKVYLFTSAGTYMNLNATTNGQGQVAFLLPDKAYKVRADYLGGQFWSDVFQSTDTAVTIDHGLVDVFVHQLQTPIDHARVYLFTNSGSYLNRYQDTDGFGMVEFMLPDITYKFRADDEGGQRWSEPLQVIPWQINDLEIDVE